MGSMQAHEMAELTDLDTALTWHLRTNHYPPVPLTMLEPCKQAIDAYWEDDLDRQIDLNGSFYRGEPFAPAREIIIAHHLDPWCADSEDEFEEE
jgi:hypothetical protein